MMEQCDIKDLVNVEVKGNAIVIEPATQSPRAGWEQQFELAKSGSEDNLMEEFSNDFDVSEWTW
ncbi:AbrB/MazE/SpoVT family DNA-binding domain-containing protein [Dyadobacter psychrophilus]|nr:AbrB/MazE/SpoVT family DNA-binding domain-containing protein [Dyadobacter psychrophilus]